MGKKLELDKKNNLDKIKIGFLLELNFRQDILIKDIENLISFINNNSDMLVNIDLFSITQGLDSLIDVFCNFTDLIFVDVDFEENYMKYLKDSY